MGNDNKIFCHNLKTGYVTKTFDKTKYSLYIICNNITYSVLEI